jgi:hypothetical protein
VTCGPQFRGHLPFLSYTECGVSTPNKVYGQGKVYPISRTSLLVDVADDEEHRAEDGDQVGYQAAGQ